MPVTLRAGSAGVTVPSPGTSQPVTLPSGAQLGDLVQIYCAGATASNSFSCPGFTASSPVSGSGGVGTVQLLYKINTTDLAGTIYTVTATTADTWGAIIVSDGSSDQLIIFDGGIPEQVSATAGTQIALPPPVQAYPLDRLNWFGSCLLPSGTNTIFPPAGFTVEVPQVNSTLAAPAQNIALMFADLQQPHTQSSGTPFTAGTLNAAAGSLTYQLSVGTTTGFGDNLLLVASTTAGAITGVADSKNQKWNLIGTTGNTFSVYQCESTAILVGGTDTVTLTITSTSGAVNMLLIDDPAALIVDISLTTSGTGTTAALATGTLNFANEHVMGFTWVTATASALAWSAPMTAFGSTPISGNSAGWLSASYDLVTATSSVTPTETWTTSVFYDMIVITFRPWSPGPGFLATAAVNGSVMVALPAAQPVPQLSSQSRGNRLQRALFGPKIRRGAAVLIPQATGGPFPLTVRQRGVRLPGVAYRVNRQRVFSAPVSQGPLAPPFIPAPVPNRFRPMMAYLHPRMRTSDNRVEVPPLPQGPLAPSWVQVPVRQPGWRRFAPKLRRPAVTTAPPPGPVAVGSPWLGNVAPKRRPWAAAILLRYERRRVFAPVPPQGPQPVGTPSIMTMPRRTRQRPFWYFRRQPRWFGRLIPKTTQQGIAHLTAASTLSATAVRQVNAIDHMTSSSRLTVTALPVARAATAALTAQSRMTPRATRTAVATAALSATNRLTVAAVNRDVARAAFTSSTTLTAAATTGSGAQLVAASRLTAAASPVSTSAAASQQAGSSLSATGQSAVTQQVITITPLQIPGVNEAPLPAGRATGPVVSSTVRGEVEDQLYDPDDV